MQYLLNKMCLSKFGFKKLGVGIVVVTFLLGFGSVALADDNKSKLNPLEIKTKTPDPLLPQSTLERPLNELETQQLRTALDELNAQATAQLNAGNSPAAFEIWYRELRLRRSLGTLEEVRSLGRVGEIAWNNNKSTEVQVITQRLQAIQQQLEARNKKPAKTSASTSALKIEDADIPALLQALATAYQQMRSPALALPIYQQILADTKARGDTTAQVATLKTMGELQMSWFDYPASAATYEELLNLALAQGDSFNQVVYIQQLAYIYDKAKKPENALKMKQQLAESYLNKKDIAQLTPLKIAIASDYEAMGKPDEASQNYQEAYSLALSIQQFAYASYALQKISELQNSYDYLDYALQVYQIRVQVDQQSYNYYGLMNTYDQMGQIYVQQKKYSDALTSFQKGLELAKSLKYQETYFTTQIDRVTQQSSQ